MAGRGFLSKLVARMQERVDRDPDPDALTGRQSSRRHGLPVALPQPDEQPKPRAGSDDERQAEEALDRIRADQHRRMRRGTFGGGSDQGG